VIRRWLRFAPWVVDPFPVYETPATYDAVRMLFPWKCRRRQQRSQSPIQFHLHCMGFGTHHCYRRLNEQFPNALARRASPRVQYSPWFVLSFFADAWAVLLEPRSHLDLVIGFDATAGGLRVLGAARFVRLHSRSGSNRIGYKVAPTPVHIQVANSRCWLTGCHGIRYDVASSPIQITNSRCWLTGSHAFWYDVASTLDPIACSIGRLTA